MRDTAHPSLPTAVAFPAPVLFSVFVLSGISALIYQIVWQRMLLTLYGSNSESVALVVAAFLMGLGIGSLAGGQISLQKKWPLVLVFSLLELGVGLYGLVSVSLFHWVGDLTATASPLLTAVLPFALVFTPTLLMGATLPLLVTHQTKVSGDVGEAVSWLYFVNTLGAALGAWFSAFFVLRLFGVGGSVKLAAILNILVAVIVLITWWVRKQKTA